MNAAQVDLRFALAALPEPPRCDGDSRWTDDDPAVRREAAKLCKGCPVFALCREAGRGEDAGIWGGIDHGPMPPRRRKADAPKAKPCQECGAPMPPRRQVVCSDEYYDARARRLRAEQHVPKPKTQTRGRALAAALDNDMAAFAELLKEPDVHLRGLAWSLARAWARELKAQDPDIRRVVSAYLLQQAAAEDA